MAELPGGAAGDGGAQVPKFPSSQVPKFPSAQVPKVLKTNGRDPSFTMKPSA